MTDLTEILTVVPGGILAVVVFWFYRRLDTRHQALLARYDALTDRILDDLAARTERGESSVPIEAFLKVLPAEKVARRKKALTPPREPQ